MGSRASRRLLLVGFLSLIGADLLIASTARADTNVSGTVTGNQIWTKAESPYQLTGFVTLVEGATLAIEPGVTVQSDLYGMSVRGVLIAVGTAADPINIGLKEGIELRAGSQGTRIAWATLRGSWTALRNRYVGEQAPAPMELHQVEFRENSDALDLWAPNLVSTSYSDLRFIKNGRAIKAHTYGDFSLSRVLIEETDGVGVKLNQVHGPSFVVQQSNLEPPENGSCTTTETGCSVALADGTVSTPAVEFKDVWWSATDEEAIESWILDGNDFPGFGYPVLDRVDDALQPHDLYPPDSSPDIPSVGAIPTATSVSGTASDAPKASTGIDHVTASLKDLVTGKWWDGSDWGDLEVFLPTTGTTDWTLSTPTMLSGRQYRIRTLAVDGSGNSQFGASSADFFVDTDPPLPFALIGPLQGEVTTATPEFSWAPTSDVGPAGLAHYEVLIDGAKVADVPAGTESFQPSAALLSGPHTWSVRAVDSVGNSEQSETRSFAVDTDPPLPFALIGPLQGEVTTATPEFSWAPTSDVGPAGLAHYEVLIDGAKVADVPAGTESFQPSVPLPPGSHVWFVRAVDSVGYGKESETRSLIVASLPNTALDVSPPLALTGQPVGFNASGSTAPPGGTIASYEWDLDGDGIFELNTETTPFASHTYSAVADLTVGLRVNSNLGTSSTTSASLSVRKAPPAGPLGVSINNGAQFTNDPKVTVSAVWPAFALTALVSNDGGFKSAQSFAVASTIPWTLDSSGPERLPKTIYVRFQGGRAGPETYQDDIILDETDPEVVNASIGGGGGSASVASASISSADASKLRRANNRRAKRRGNRGNRVLRIRARDNVSGVCLMQIAQGKRSGGKWRPFKSRVRLKGKARRIFVRVRDRAGNVSKWRLAKS